MSKEHHNVTATLRVMLATAEVQGDLYSSWYDIPVASREVSTERKMVEQGDGASLKRFLQAPVHTSPDPAQPATRALPAWMYQAIEGYIVEHGRDNCGYTFELVAIGEPWIRWVLQRLLSRTSMRFHRHGPLSLATSDSGVRQRAEGFQLVYWRHDIHFVMRMNAFRAKPSMDAWIRQHPPSDDRTAIDRHGTRPTLSNPPAAGKGRLWFESMGSYKPRSLPDLDDDAAAFAFRKLSNWQLFKAYCNRGPGNPIFSFFNMPLEAARLHWDQCKPGNLLVKFGCDLRLEIYT